MISNADYFQGKQDKESELAPTIQGLRDALEQAQSKLRMNSVSRQDTLPMNDKELADRVVALGAGEKDAFRRDMYCLGMFHSIRYEADKFVRDWRVAGALMEKTIKDDRIDLRCVSGSWMPSLERFDACVASSATPTYGVYLDRSSESLPRAIIEACVEALEPVLEGREPT